MSQCRAAASSASCSGSLVVRLVRVGFGGLAVVVPDAEDAAHGDVQLAVCGVVHLPGQFQHPEDLIIT